ncbi:sulfite exporter TauE/SafE family protein [Bacillus sp. Marseille-P3800]|uniref:sulfite exporter TauE/SafE family protein n=1 Tax=Bacillus sp. Marseille-P3800 TaxID=2014782 RepID=UPI00210012E4|nr:sulfite exporter TauE/SafE family protein [Bacillus sp. Marseille-P3800]
MILLFLLVGFIAGAFGSLLGLGGGVIVVPALLLMPLIVTDLNTISAQAAAGTSLATMIITGLSSVLAYHKQRVIDVKSAFIFLIGIVPGAVLGAFVSRALPTEAFLVYFGFFMLVIALSLFFRPKHHIEKRTQKSYWRTGVDESGKPFAYGFSYPTAILISIVVGFLSSLFGVGGGAIMVPVMMLVLGYPIKIATATAMLIVLFSAIVGTGAHAIGGHIEWMLVLALIPGAWLGATFGAWLNRRLQSNMLLIVMRVVFIALAIQLIVQGFM